MSHVVSVFHKNEIFRAKYPGVVMCMDVQMPHASRKWSLHATGDYIAGHSHGASMHSATAMAPPLGGTRYIVILPGDWELNQIAERGI